jgi:hypothetical protein
VIPDICAEITIVFEGIWLKTASSVTRSGNLAGVRSATSHFDLSGQPIQNHRYLLEADRIHRNSYLHLPHIETALYCDRS